MELKENKHLQFQDKKGEKKSFSPFLSFLWVIIIFQPRAQRVIATLSNSIRLVSLHGKERAAREK